ncbi:hypothetical protein J2Z76_002711 [Sedimentibacter acidaminivorans]|uniref:Phage P2 GpU n=1 Tax=Sedimentibacter acidaminivorans TaxID=913099 RepID=A0ABS4GGL8_9FIRM|nr:phage tail protein [Sedimentibacter acidaminivorans]MBP1926841.1 hypothetical protein [Sedimentibacter acidaminivorans]
MKLCEFGGKIFTVSSNRIYTFDNLERSSELSIEEQELEGNKPSTYIKGPGLDKINFTIHFSSSSKLNIRDEIESWIRLKDNCKPHYIIIGEKIYGGNKYLLTNVSITEQEILYSGDISKANVKLDFVEYVRPGNKEVATSTSNESKAAEKRENENCTQAQLKMIEMLEDENFSGNE